MLKYQSEYQLYKHSAEIKPWCPTGTRISEGGFDEGHEGRGKGWSGVGGLEEGGEEGQEGGMLFQDKGKWVNDSININND